MRIEADIKLDFKDVLIRPKRSTLRSRSEVRARVGKGGWGAAWPHVEGRCGRRVFARPVRPSPATVLMCCYSGISAEMNGVRGL